MKKIAALTASLAFATLASAQANNFGGFSLGLNADMTATSSEVTVSTVTGKGLGQQSVGASLQGAYGFSISPATVLSLGLTYSLADINAGELTISGTGTGKYKLKNAYSVYIEPGFNISPSTLGYLKISYEAAAANADRVGGSENKDVNGVGLGVGMRALLAKNIYLQVEARQVQYNTVTFTGAVDFKPAATYGTIGVGYKF